MKLLLNIVLILFLNSFWAESRQSVPCPKPKLKNGRVQMKNRGKGARFTCEPGFELDGQKNILCKMGRWDADVPVCTKSGCRSPDKRLHGQVQDEQTTARLYCDRGYKRSGNSVAYCNGENWDRILGECRSSNVDTKVCDFETDSICDWTKDPKNDFQWVRKNGWKSFEKIETGPQHDHTIGEPLNGYYIVAEATNQNTANKSRFYSPIYEPSDSLKACFRFYYHMYGAIVGTLRVYVKPLSLKLDDIDDIQKMPIYFEKKNSQENHWNEGWFLLKPINESFQIVFEARGTRANSIFDIAIDDVALMNGTNCTHEQIESSVVENGGIYTIQTCSDRCNETQSTIYNKALAIMQPMVIINGSIHEKCDCHAECVDLDSCCLDYKSICDGPNEDNSSDTIEMITEITTMMIDISTTPESINTSTKISPTSTMASSIAATTTKRIEQTTTTSIMTTKATTEKATSTTTASTTAKSVTPKPTFPKSQIQTTIRTSTASVTPKPTSTKPIFIPTTVKPIIRMIKPKETTKIHKNHTIPSTNGSYFIACGMVLCGTVICLVGYLASKYSNKWNRYNSQSIEYKSNYYSKRMEEPLFDDDTFPSGDYINGACIVEEKPLDNNLTNGNVAAARPTSQIQFKSHKLAKIRRPTSYLKKHIDQYSDEKCLTEDGDDSIDFLPHAN